jgi:hypothetical protein
MGRTSANSCSCNHPKQGPQLRCWGPLLCRGKSLSSPGCTGRGVTQGKPPVNAGGFAVHKLAPYLKLGETMGRLWQVGLGLVLAFVCLSIADTQTVTKNRCTPEGLQIACTVTEPTVFGNVLTFTGWFFVVVAVLNLAKFFRGK